MYDNTLPSGVIHNTQLHKPIQTISHPFKQQKGKIETSKLLKASLNTQKTQYW